MSPTSTFAEGVRAEKNGPPQTTESLTISKTFNIHGPGLRLLGAINVVAAAPVTEHSTFQLVKLIHHPRVHILLSMLTNGSRILS